MTDWSKSRPQKQDHWKNVDFHLATSRRTNSEHFSGWFDTHRQH